MADNSKYGAFIPTTNIFDIENLDKIKLDSPEFKDFIVRLRQIINNISLTTNIKDSGYYVLTEFLNGQRFFEDPTLNSTTAKAPTSRQVYRKVINFGALPNAASKSVAHGLTIQDSWSFTRIYATATDTTAHAALAIPLGITTSGGAVSVTGTLNLATIKWSDSTAPISASGTVAGSSTGISITVDATNVIITTGSDRTSFNKCYVILEYIKE